MIGTSTPARQTVGLFRLAAGVLLLAAIVVQIADRIVHDAFVPSEYFSYFTIQSSMMNVVVLVVGAGMAFRLKRDTVLYTGVRMAVLVYAVVTGLVYNVLLRGIPSTDNFVPIAWPVEVEHVWIPLYVFIDWLFATGRARLAWVWLWAAIGYPLAWCAYTLVHGAVSGWYPYPFIDPNGPAGWGGVIGYIIGIAALIVGLAALAIGYSRWNDRQRDE